MMAELTKFAFLAAFLSTTATLPTLSAQHPNVVFIMADDQGYWDTGATGNPHIDTPNINRIAREGMQLDRYYAAMVCAPTRAGLMTGRYYLRTGLYNTRFGGDSLGLDEITMAQQLRKAGYRTGMFGKWHLGKYPPYQPQNRGFDEFMGHYHGHIERYQFPDQIYHNGDPVEARGYVTDLFTDASIDFIEQASTGTKQPFFCALTYNAPHSPFLLDTSHYEQGDGDALIEKYLARGLPIREARIYAMVERIDQNVGRLLAKLDELGITDETLVVYTSDNGGVSKFYKGGMNGNKASAYEGGVRAPCFVRWPGRIPSGAINRAQISHVDWFPTFCELAGTSVPTDRVIDGKSLVRLLTEKDIQRHHRHVYHTWDRYQPNPDRRWSISDDRWKLLCQVGTTVQPSRKNWRLFDLDEDPGEKKNLASKHPETVDRLRAEFVRWYQDVTDGQTYQPVRIPVADEAVEISPSWGQWFGDHIRYEFDGYDWDTIEGWREKGERVSWRLLVDQPGDYEVVLRYGCRPVDAGGIIRVAVSGQMAALQHQVVATSTADQFQTRKIGQVRLVEGESELVAELVNCPGRELMRLNRVELVPK